MFLYYLWAMTEKALSCLPLGKQVYSGIGLLVNKRSRGRIGNLATSLKLARKGKEIIPPGGVVLEVGSGWFHHDAFIFYLMGDYKVYLFDVEDKARVAFIKSYLRNLLAQVDHIAAELNVDEDACRSKLQRLLDMRTREEIYGACNFTLCITQKTDQLFLPENSVDFMVSNCVLSHIRTSALDAELKALRTMLKDEGCMYFLIGHDDHWAFHDSSANQFNYYRYSDRLYKRLFESLEYHNRLVKQEWLRVFERCGLDVAEYEAYVTDSSRKEIADLPHIDSRFAQYPLEELAIIYSYVLLRKHRD